VVMERRKVVEVRLTYLVWGVVLIGGPLLFPDVDPGVIVVVAALAIIVNTLRGVSMLLP
jgi:hypothetical protein